MSKIVKNIIIILVSILGIIVLDTVVARISKSSPIISWKEKLNGDSYVDKGILMDTYYCQEQDLITVNWLFKTSKFTCPIELKKIDSLAAFYNTPLTKDIDIRKLSPDYNFDMALKDNILVEANGQLYNFDNYLEFKKAYQNKQSAFIRIGKSTIEGDLIIYDLLYYDDTIYLVVDATRDKYGTNTGLKIENYEKMIMDDALILYNENIDAGYEIINLENMEVKDE